MDNWTILNIPPTEDPEAIRKAYMLMLPNYNPEDDPEGFLRLRAAYEQILKELKDKSENQKSSNTPLAQFMHKMAEVYNDFSRRCSLKEWKQLLNDEVCMRLDLEDNTSDHILVFLMNHYYLPQNVWILLNDHFDWQSKASVLKQNYPATYIDFVISSAKYDNMNYELFTIDPDYLGHVEAAQYDRWLWLYYEIEANIHLPDKESSSEEELEALPIKHIYYDLQKARKHIYKAETEAALAITKPIYEKYPEENRVQYIHGLALLAADQLTDAIKLFEVLLEKIPGDLSAKKALIEALIVSEEYETARVLLLEILDEYPYSSFALHAFRVVTENLIQIYEEKHEEDKEDMDIVLTLAKHYLNGYQYVKCLTILEGKNYEHPRYYEYLADCYQYGKRYDKSIEMYQKNIALEQGYRNYVKFISALIDAGKYGQALLRVEEAFLIEDTDKLSLSYLHDSKGLILHQLGQYEKALDAFDEAIEINNQAAHIYTHKAQVFKEMRRYSEAIENCEKAISIFPYNTDPYTIQMEIFRESEFFDQMIALAERADQLGFESPRISYHKACALRMLNRTAEAKIILEDLINDEYDEGYRDFFHEEAAQLAITEGNYESALNHIIEALKIDKEHPKRYILAGNAYRLDGNYVDALELYDELLSKLPENAQAFIGRGDLYFDMKNYEQARNDYNASLALIGNNENVIEKIIQSYLAEDNFSEALKWTEKALELFNKAGDHLRFAWLHIQLKQPEKAEEAYLKTIEEFHNNEKVYRHYGMFLMDAHRYEEAAPHFRISLERDPHQPTLYSELAQCLSQTEQYEDALRVLDKYEALYPEEAVDFSIQRGVIYHKLNCHQKSIECLLKAAAHEGKNGEHWNKPYLYTLIGLKYAGNFNNGEEALKYYQIALEIDENCAEAIKYIGDIYLYHYQDYPSAFKYYNRKIELEPEDPYGYAARGYAFRVLKKYLRAYRDFKTALALFQGKQEKHPGNLRNKMNIAFCCMGLRKYSIARDMYLEFLESAPITEHDAGDLSDCYYGLGLICEYRKKYPEALEYYEKAVEFGNSIRNNRARGRIVSKNQ